MGDNAVTTNAPSIRSRSCNGADKWDGFRLVNGKAAGATGALWPVWAVGVRISLGAFVARA
jgi:hypothetical protein